MFKKKQNKTRNVRQFYFDSNIGICLVVGIKGYAYECLPLENMYKGKNAQTYLLSNFNLQEVTYEQHQQIVQFIVDAKGSKKNG